jgi:hypothetical protein
VSAYLPLSIFVQPRPAAKRAAKKVVKKVSRKIIKRK